MKLLALAFVVVSSVSLAGGSTGGSPGLALELVEFAFNVESLPKTYLDSEDFRRVKARLSVAGTESIPALVDGETLDLKAFRDSVVDVKFSKEILPSDYY
jgi:hypothetical protein